MNKIDKVIVNPYIGYPESEQLVFDYIENEKTYKFKKIYVTFAEKPLNTSTMQIKMNKAINFYPNPVVNFCQIKSSSNTNIKQVQIISVSGNEIALSYNKETSMLDCTPLPKGIYVVVIETTDGKKEYCKLIKK